MTIRSRLVKRFAGLFVVLGFGLLVAACDQQGQGGTEAAPPITSSVKLYQHGQAVQTLPAPNDLRGADGGLIWFDDASGKRVILAGDFVYEPDKQVSAPANYKPTHKLRFFQDGKEVRSWLLADVRGADKSMIWFDDPATGKRVIVHGTFTYEPIDSPVAMGQYKPDYQIQLIQDGRVIQFWLVRGKGTTASNGLVWFDDDYTKLRVIISGPYVYAPIAK